MKYRKTQTIDAEQFDGSDEMADKYGMWKPHIVTSEWWLVKTFEGNMMVHVGGWIATGIDGEHWPIADVVFKRTYEPMEEK